MRSSTSLFLAWLVAGCRMGGPGGSAIALQETLQDAGVEEAAASPSGPSQEPPGASPSTDPPPPATNSNGSADAGESATVEAGITDGGAAAVTDAGAPVSFGNACRPAFTGCDAIQNTDCPPLMQCIVDSASVGAVGTCAFSNIPVDAGLSCAQNPLGTSCPAGHGCVNDMCLRYCACDDDCEGTSTCSVEVATGSLSDVRACSP